TVVSLTFRSISIEGSATLTIATSRMVMKNAAPTIPSVSQRRSPVVMRLLPGRLQVRTRSGENLFQLWRNRYRCDTSGVSVGTQRIGLAVLVAALACAVVAVGGQARREARSSCPSPQLDPAYVASVNAALASRQDIWGDQLLRTSYVGANGVEYRQESFATRIPQTGSLVSFVRVTAGRGGRVRFDASVRGLRRVGNQLRLGRRAVLVFGPGARVHGSTVSYRGGRTAYAAWISKPSRTKPFRLDTAYVHASHSVAVYWARRLAAGATITVPDRVVMHAERNLLIQNLSHAWRYSLANPYARFSWELLDVAEVMGEYGFIGAERAIVEKSFARGSGFPNRSDGD